MKVKTGSKLAIFDTFKTKGERLTGEAQRQRAIISILGEKTNPAERTRTAISQNIAKGHGISWKNLYSGIFRDLDEILIPLGIVEEDGRLPLKRGPKALQEKGIPYYHLTKRGILIALSINEIKNRQVLLKRFFDQTDSKEKNYENIILELAESSPNFIYSVFQKYAKAYCDNKIELMPFNLSKLKELEDESLKVQKELLEAFIDLNKTQRENAIKFLNTIS
ncbi:MAG: hypothetical protein R3327_01075 [Nitrosopumilaceae archaeon]|nr:hypothetical protein [Nitrosopumilaceae archaeon]